MDSTLLQLNVSQAVQRLRNRDFTVKEYILAHLTQIESLEPQLRAWVVIDEKKALLAANILDQKLTNQQDTGTLLGIPVGVKDIFNTSDMPTQMGSPIWDNFTPGNDARVVHNLRMADSVILGKTVTAEFAVHTPGPTLNPHNNKYMTGTSSSGSAVAVATYMVPLALGTQTAGSTVRPASYNGVIGFKPSFGLLPRTGMLKTTDSLDTVGLIGRAVEDIQLLFEVCRVHGSNYPISHQALNDPARQNKPNTRPWRVALVTGPTWHHAEPYAQEALFSYAKKLTASGLIEVEEITLQPSFGEAHEIHSTIYDRTLAYYFQDEFRKHTLISDVMYEIIAKGSSTTLEQYKNALKRQTLLASLLDDLLSTTYDVVLTLSTGGEALKGVNSIDRPDSCLIWTLCGAPVISLPVFTGPTGLPFGVQLVGRRFNDYRVLKLAKYLYDVGLAPRAPYPVPSLVTTSQFGTTAQLAVQALPGLST